MIDDNMENLSLDGLDKFVVELARFVVEENLVEWELLEGIDDEEEK